MTDIQNRMGVLYLLITQAMFMTGNAVLYLCMPTPLPVMPTLSIVYLTPEVWVDVL